MPNTYGSDGSVFVKQVAQHRASWRKKRTILFFPAISVMNSALSTNKTVETVLLEDKSESTRRGTHDNSVNTTVVMTCYSGCA